MKKFPALFGMTGVILGAFGAHRLHDQLAASGRLDVWQTAVLYQLIHAVALLAINATLLTNFANERPHCLRWLRRAMLAWNVGVILFSGSLYWVALDGPRWLWPFAPAGGLLLIAGWACVMIATCAKPGSFKNNTP